jgi:hypothetical protein
LTAALRDPDPHLRLGAAAALTRVSGRPEPGVLALLAVLEDADAEESIRNFHRRSTMSKARQHTLASAAGPWHNRLCRRRWRR